MKKLILSSQEHAWQRQRGFTLAEIAVVIVIAGVLLATFAGSLSMYVNKAENRAVRTNMDTIQQALEEFYNGAGRFPCPAPANAPPDTAAFGAEVSVAGPPISCNAGAGGITQVGAGPTSVLIGSLPVRSLNLPDQYAQDSWGNRYRYAVTLQQATFPGYANGSGRIAVIDSTNGNILSLAGTADYVVVSHGPDGAGATSNQGVNGIACPAVAAQQNENCDDAATASGACNGGAGNCVVFRKTTLTATVPGNNYFDDYVIFRAGSVGATSTQAVPTGAVMAFNLPACPTGWTAYAPAVGRAVIGAGNYNETYNTGDRPNWTVNAAYASGVTGGFASYPLIINEMPNHTHNLDQAGVNATIVNGGGAIAGTISRGAVAGGAPILTTPVGGVNVPIPNMPPYVPLLYCQKD